MSKLRNLCAQYYVSDSVFENERDRVFGSSWQYLGAASKVDRPGNYVSAVIAGAPVLIIRGRDGQLRAFRNACRHRGAPLIEPGAGRCPRQIRCPYHLWSYSDSGELLDAPWFGDSDDFALEDWPLNSIAVETWRGLLFAAIAPTQTLREQLGATVDELSDVPIDEYLHGADAQLEFDANWKIYTDNFVEGYHIPGIHPAFFQAIDFENFKTEPRDGIVCMSAPTDSELFYQGRWYWMWPNWTLSLYPEGMSTSRINPTSAGHTELYYSFFFADLDESKQKDRDALIEKNLDVIREDFAICLGVHQNYASRNYDPGPLSPRHELGVEYFQTRLRGALAE